MDGWMGGLTHAWRNEWMDGWTHAWRDGWMGGHMHGGIDDSRADEGRDG